LLFSIDIFEFEQIPKRVHVLTDLDDEQQQRGRDRSEAGWTRERDRFKINRTLITPGSRNGARRPFNQQQEILEARLPIA
jgi:hypothetical protein